MEKITLKPIAHEISISGANPEGPADAFSYSPDEQDSTRMLGNLYVVGNISHPTDDLAYALNLIAALAKREYYARPGIAIKEAFANTLRKVNEVVSELFENNGAKINMGIFAIADGSLLISKLGKFKLFLARSGGIVDVLNNVEHFEKDADGTGSQFSNIISGKVQEHDRLLALFPNRSLTTRERFVKSDFDKLDKDAFIAKLAAIREQKDTFSCAALYITVQKIREITAPAPSFVPEPQQQQVRFAQAPQQHETPPIAQPTSLGAEEAIPRIIPSEFSLGRKKSPFVAFFRRLGLTDLNPRSRAIALALTITVIVGGTLFVRSLVTPSAEEEALAAVIADVRNQVKIAKTKVSQNQIPEARALLGASLVALNPFLTEEDAAPAAKEMRSELFSELNTLDQAKLAEPQLAFDNSKEEAKIRHIAAQNGLYIYRTTETVGTLNAISTGSIADAITVPANATALTGSDSLHTVIAGTSAAAVKGQSVTPITLSTSLAHLEQFGDNLYGVANGTIMRIVGAAQGKGSASAWLKSGAALPADVVDIAIDGNIYAVTTTGTLLTYYKGERTAEVSTGLPVSPASQLFTGVDLPYVYILDTVLNRLYLIDKKSGSLFKTITFPEDHAVVTATVHPNGSLFYLTDDQKVWQVQ
ncbi:MAG: hypothetical protein QY311_00080 [Candidatus Paceibacterota bacterium]|nr:MAG: hypothetical protein QY311_00080 [Candidatus Paceibacterota bacterium]